MTLYEMTSDRMTNDQWTALLLELMESMKPSPRSMAKVNPLLAPVHWSLAIGHSTTAPPRR